MHLITRSNTTIQPNTHTRLVTHYRNTEYNHIEIRKSPPGVVKRREEPASGMAVEFATKNG